jgi:hypothetical protein
LKFSFHPEAKFELTQAVEFYQTREINLGAEFLDEVFGAITRIVEYPQAFPNFSPNTRKCLINRFPFAIIYQIRKEEIFIIAITHLSRKPGYWKERSGK